MNIPDVTMERVLTQANLVSAEQLTTLKEEAARSKRSLQTLALDQKITDIIGLTKAFASYAQIDYIELVPNEIPPEVINKIPERIARQYNAVLFKIDESGVHHLAMEDPDDIQAVNFIQKEIGSNTHIYIATHENILAALEEYHSNVDQQLNEVIDVQREQSEKLETVTEQDIAEDSPIAQTVNLLLEYAIRSHASDIHIEPREEFVQIRYRIDGVLREVNRLPKNVEGALVSRIKIMANLKIDERRVPQDGRFKIKIGGKQYALRVSSMPVNDGEKVVMRILDESSEAISLESLGYWGRSLEIIQRSMTLPNGMILFTGPTGSGKSTSLFSILTMLNKPTVNIATIEDPVEYRVPGVNQTQVNPKAGMTFANGLRALLRQDPNIIMVGEIRDGETAGLGIQASLTGHMVFSTLHTNNAATTLPRLLDMQIEPFLIASTVTAVVGQRLVRRLDQASRQSFEPTPAEKEAIIKMFNIPAGQDFRYIHELEKQAMAAGVGGDTPLSTDENGILHLWKADDTANTDDVQSGYKGRVGIYEVLENTEPIQRLIMANANSIDIQAEAIKEGMLTMLNDGLIKALRGETTVQEVLRVSKD
jgi:type IV pilus assembly protein PilB